MREKIDKLDSKLSKMVEEKQKATLLVETVKTKLAKYKKEQEAMILKRQLMDTRKRNGQTDVRI